ncbi:hypothetical protein A2U01_0101066, partial [Trifolium medium]|nr:hypothetical protein [Trifolium medium]
ERRRRDESGAQGSSGGSHHVSMDGPSSLANNDWKH